jgi:predicted nucleic acid-binding protein
LVCVRLLNPSRSSAKIVTVKVIDAFVAAAILFVENEADMAMSMIDDADLVAPRLLPFELANVAVTKIRRHPEDRRKIVEGLNRSKAMGIRLQEAPETEAYELALALNLSAYDASYLWLSKQIEAELLTFDKRLAAAARR